MNAALWLSLSIPGAVLAVSSLYLVVLALASIGQGRTPAPETVAGQARIVVLIPAHDEELLVGRCIRSLVAQSYPRDLYRIVVIADNCSDLTAAVAREAGAAVLVRDDPDARGKGHALRWAIDTVLPDPTGPDAIVVVDADSVADSNFLAAMAAELDRGREVVQADYSLLEGPGGHTSDMMAAGFLLFHRVRFRGRARLGMAANLVGNGMLFSTRVLAAHPWSAFTAVEDLEYSIGLRLAGIRPRFAPAARIAGPGPASGAGAVRQRMRWEGGRFHVVRRQMPPLIRAAVARGDLSLLDAAIDLSTPPLGLLTLGAIAGALLSMAAASAGLVPWWAALPWVMAAALVPAFVVIGLWSVGETARLWRVARGAPLYLAWKLMAYARLVRGYDVRRWDRTDRVAS